MVTQYDIDCKTDEVVRQRDYIRKLIYDLADAEDLLMALEGELENWKDRLGFD